ncbi:MAG: hypothetical protein LBH00_12995, partial [Planctomycetaceae bacterium]|nr:hypothetical protein [Planctomycetaceae bacterium]
KQSKIQRDTDPGGQDSFLDIVSNVVGILIILVMLAGIRAQHSAASVPAADSPPADAQTLAGIEAEYQAMLEKSANTAQIRHNAEELQTKVQILAEQYRLQGLEHSAYFDAMTTLRAAVESAAGTQGAVKEAAETRRQLAEVQAELDRAEKAKNDFRQQRPQATVLENIPTPLGKTVENKEIHLRLLGGKVVYVPFPELVEQLKRHVADEQNKYIKQRSGSGKVGPIDHFYLEFLLAVFDVPMPGGIGSRIELRYAEVVPQFEPLGEPVQSAMQNSVSEFQKKLSQYRKDLYTVTVWVYPDSFDAYQKLKQFLQDKGYTVAARPITAGSPISGSPFGTKSTTQ